MGAAPSQPSTESQVPTEEPVAMEMTLEEYGCRETEVEKLKQCPYLSPLITIIVGPPAAQVTFYIHQDRLLQLPFFQAALRPNAFIEGEQGKIHFEEEDPQVFCRFVEYLYEGDFFPRKHGPNGSSLEVDVYVQSNLPGGKLEIYGTPESMGGLQCGIFTATEVSYRIFENVVLMVCLAHRYFDPCLGLLAYYKLLQLPMGTREFSCFAKHVLKSVPKTKGLPYTGFVYTLLEERFCLLQPRLAHCEFFQALQRSDDVVVLQGLLKLMNKSEEPFTKYSEAKYELEGDRYGLAICRENVNTLDCIDWYGSMVGPQGMPFGAALKGEILLTNMSAKGRGVFLGGPAGLPEHCWLSYPCGSFCLLDGDVWDTEEMEETDEEPEVP